MPITQSAKKALRASLRRRMRNMQKKEAYKKVTQNIRKLAATGQWEQAKNLIPQAYKTLDKAAKTNVIKKNKASRLKSRLTKLVAAKTS